MAEKEKPKPQGKIPGDVKWENFAMEIPNKPKKPKENNNSESNNSEKKK